MKMCYFNGFKGIVIVWQGESVKFTILLFPVETNAVLEAVNVI